MLHQYLEEILRELAKHKEAQIVEGHLMGDHVHICISIPPKHAVSNVVDYIKGKSAIAIARRFGRREQNFTGEVFWARGYFVSTVGLDEAMVRTQYCSDSALDGVFLLFGPLILLNLFFLNEQYWVRTYIRNQEEEDERYNQMKLGL